MVESDQTVERAYVGGDEWREAPRCYRSVHRFVATHTDTEPGTSFASAPVLSVVSD